MEAEIAQLGNSLPVPCVQELAKEPLTSVPPRYVRFDQNSPLTSAATTATSLLQIPVIDMERLISPKYMDKELEKFHHACENWGFFQNAVEDLYRKEAVKEKLEKKKLVKLHEDACNLRSTR